MICHAKLRRMLIWTTVIGLCAATPNLAKATCVGDPDIPICWKANLSERSSISYGVHGDGRGTQASLDVAACTWTASEPAPSPWRSWDLSAVTANNCWQDHFPSHQAVMEMNSATCDDTNARATFGPIADFLESLASVGNLCGGDANSEFAANAVASLGGPSVGFVANQLWWPRSHLCLTLLIDLLHPRSIALFRSESCFNSLADVKNVYEQISPRLASDGLWLGGVVSKGFFLAELSAKEIRPAASQGLDRGSIEVWLKAVSAAAANTRLPLPARDDPIPGASRTDFRSRVARWIAAGTLRLSATIPAPDGSSMDASAVSARNWLARAALLATPETLIRPELLKFHISPEAIHEDP